VHSLEVVFCHGMWESYREENVEKLLPGRLEIIRRLHISRQISDVYSTMHRMSTLHRRRTITSSRRNDRSLLVAAVSTYVAVRLSAPSYSRISNVDAETIASMFLSLPI
jgi:hypothetical protein